MRGGWIATLALACAHGTPTLPAFEGPGRLLLILERGDARELLVFDAVGSRIVQVAAVASP